MTQIDATGNDIPEGFDVTGFPTIYLVPKTNQPVKYQGNRELNDLIDFIGKHINEKTEL
jgi:protein disulfide-isomerase A3